MTLKGQIQDHSDFQPLLSCNGAELDHMLLVNINGKAYMGSSKTLSHMTLSDLERSKSGSPDFEALYIVKEQSYSIGYYQTSLQKIVICHTNFRFQAEKQCPRTSCFAFYASNT